MELAPKICRMHLALFQLDLVRVVMTQEITLIMNLAEQDTEIQRGARCLSSASFDFALLQLAFIIAVGVWDTNSIDRESCFYKSVSGLQGCELALLLKICSLRFLLGAGNKKTLICKTNLLCQLSMHEMQFYCGETIKFIFKSQIGRIHLRGANKIASARDNVITMTISHTQKNTFTNVHVKKCRCFTMLTSSVFFILAVIRQPLLNKPTSSDIHRMKFRLLDNIDKTSNLYCRGLNDVHGCIKIRCIVQLSDWNDVLSLTSSFYSATTATGAT